MKFKEIDPTKCSDCGKELTYNPDDSRFGKPIMALCADCMIKTSKSFGNPQPNSIKGERRRVIMQLEDKIRLEILESIKEMHAKGYELQTVIESLESDIVSERLLSK